MNNTIKKIHLLNTKENTYTGATFINEKYIILQSSLLQIIEYGTIHKYINKVSGNHTYTSITINNDSFYVSSLNNQECLFQLNKDYKVIKKIYFNKINPYKDFLIKAISYNKQNNEIIITNKRTIYSINSSGDFIENKISDKTSHLLLSNEHDHFTSSCTYNEYLYIAYTKNNTSFLAKIDNKKTLLENHYIEKNALINSIFEVKGKLHCLLTLNNNNYIYIMDPPFFIDLKANHHHKDCCIHPCGCEHPKDVCQSTDCDIMESIALMEVSLAHILNAEGEKIQKGIELSTSINELLKINESVSKTIKETTNLEIVLVEKLECICKKKSS